MQEVLAGTKPWAVVRGDCLEVMRGIPDGSVDMIATDPPYYRVKDEDWDNQWQSESAFLEWIGDLCIQWQRILKPNGSLYVFASPDMSARIEVAIREKFNFLNRIRWVKDAGWHKKADKEALRCFLSPHEEIIFAEQYGSDTSARGESGWESKCDELRGFVFEPLRAYLAAEFKRAGVNFTKANEFCNTSSIASGHYFARSQWCFPTAEHYAALRRGLNSNGEHEYLRREYEELRREYEELRREYEEMRRPFNLTDGDRSADIWDFPVVSPYPGKHPCEKPVSLWRHILKVSSRPDAVVLDTFCGGGSLGEVCWQMGRRFIGIELDPHWANKSRQRIQNAQPLLFAI